MRTIERTTAFKKAFKRTLKQQHGNKVEGLLREALRYLLIDRPLPAKYRDHQLGGEWKDTRDCHLRPDLVLFYRKVGTDVLQLVDIGSHSDLGI